jgi:DNA-binding GntR family transcriptional regulator
MGEVVAAATHPGEPLTYYRGSFGRFEHDAERLAYTALRAWVLRRGTPVHGVLDPIALADKVHSRPEYLRPALVRLEAEGLVTRGVDGSASTAPMTLEQARGAFAAQAAIESGVIDTCLAHAQPHQLDAVHSAAEALTEAAASAAGIEAQLDGIRGLHHAIVGLSPSRQLLAAFDELSTGALWHHVLDPDEQAQMLDNRHLLEVAAAITNKDTEKARDALRRQLDLATTIAARAIDARGGSV